VWFFLDHWNVFPDVVQVIIRHCNLWVSVAAYLLWRVFFKNHDRPDVGFFRVCSTIFWEITLEVQDFLLAGCSSCYLNNSIKAHVYFYRFNGHFPVEPGLVVCLFNILLGAFRSIFCQLDVFFWRQPLDITRWASSFLYPLQLLEGRVASHPFSLRSNASTAQQCQDTEWKFWNRL